VIAAIAPSEQCPLKVKYSTWKHCSTKECYRPKL